jgi:arabinogalactan oligomer/maltooligosaccharide transport system substrate-binding protein
VGSYLDYGLFFSAGHLHGLGGQLMDEKGDPTFNNEKGLKWIEMIKKFEESGPIENNTDNDVSLFQEGRAGIIIDGLWNAVSLAEAIGAENLVIDPWPANMSGYVQTDIIYLNANLSSDDAVCGWSLMEFMLSPEAHVIFSDPSMAGYIPTIVGVEVTDPIQQQVLVAFAGGTAFPVILEMGAYWDPVNNALLSAIEQGTDPAEALQAAHDAVVAKVAEIRGE